MTQSTNIKVKMHTVHKKHIVPFLGIGKCQHSAQIQAINSDKNKHVFCAKATKIVSLVQTCN